MKILPFYYKIVSAIFFLCVLQAVSSAQTYRLNKSFGPYENTGPIRLIAISPDGALLATNGNGGNISIIDADSGRIIKTLKGHNHRVSSITFSSNGKYLASASADGSVILWNVIKGNAVKTFSPASSQSKTMSFVDFALEDKELIFGGENMQLYKAGNITDPKKADHSLVFSVQQPVSAGKYNNENDFYIFGSGKFLYMKRAEQTEPSIFGTASDEITAVAISPDGKLIAVRCKNSLIDIWSTEKRSKIRTFKSATKAQEADFTQLSFSDDGKYLVTGSNDGMPTVWSVEDSKSLFDLYGHKGKVIPVQFSGEKKIIVTGSDDGTIKIWQMLKLPEEEEAAAAKKNQQTKNDTNELPSPELKFSQAAKEDTMPTEMAGRGVTSTNPKPVVVSSRSITIYVWDDDQADGDIISLNLNGKWVLENHKLTKKKKIVNVRLEPYKNNYILLFAHNEGDVPPNTAGISIWDGFTETKLSLKSDLKSSDSVKLLLK